MPEIPPSPTPSAQGQDPAMLAAMPVFFSPEMVVPDANSYSPSAGKPGLVLQDWQQSGLAVDIRSVTPVTRGQLALAHDRAFVDGVLDCKRPNGFGNRLSSIAASLPYTSGAMLGAAREALRNGRVACAPVSGFHHAGHSFTGGFCTFNGLMVAAAVLHQEGVVRRVAVLDLDEHFGNGTEDIIERQGWSWIAHHTSGALHLGPADAERYLRDLPDLIKTWAGCDVLLYQAGADAHIDDPLGGWMTTEQLRRRDIIVFETAHAMGLPVAWNLAGGYQKDPHGGIPKVLEIHRNTLQACLAVHAGGPCQPTPRPL